ncbi:MAG: twin-arginine translocase TatA/TatE family subunit [Micavibrio aeruginosavorus]|uniref:Sec-independent protein translocase protein TatA n=1 Tax=Micavibrio aeruginosavorus TaxID=349221 RepID=A0A7T5UJ48_9BACT|nr:MAG: twin-arginine translocase TatA/TatE family subunit [Micavibrio aeruginosavorus]
MGLSFWHLLIVILVVVLVFGTKRLPNVMEDLAKGIKSFKKGLKDEDETKTLAQDKKDRE